MRGRKNRRGRQRIGPPAFSKKQNWYCTARIIKLEKVVTQFTEGKETQGGLLSQKNGIGTASSALSNWKRSQRNLQKAKEEKGREDTSNYQG